MKKLLALLIVGFMATTAFAEAEVKQVCHDKVGKDGKPVMKDGKAVQECKKIKTHKKLEGTEIPAKK